MQRSHLGENRVLAGVGTRFLAELVNGLVVGIPLGLSGSAAGGGGDGTGPNLLSMLLGLAGFALFVYQLVLYSRGKSIGKKVLGLTVVSEGTSTAVGFWRMLFREWIGKWVSGFAFGLGFLWAIWDSKRQAWHDKIFGTQVIKDS